MMNCYILSNGGFCLNDNIDNRNDNLARGFMMYEVLDEPLRDYWANGDGSYVLPTFPKDRFPAADVIDIPFPNLIRLLSTAYGQVYQDEGFAIACAMRDAGVAKKVLRFRSRHPLYANGSQLYQNACLISGMIYLGIPIPDYFDGDKILVPIVDEDFIKFLEYVDQYEGE